MGYIQYSAQLHIWIRLKVYSTFFWNVGSFEIVETLASFVLNKDTVLCCLCAPLTETFVWVKWLVAA